MVVDDEPINVEVLSCMLQEKSYTVDCASSGYQALDLIMKRNELVRQGYAQMYKLILLDFSMPDIDGPEVARQIRIFLKKQSQSEAEIPNPVICCCTAYTDSTFMRQAYLAGMNKFLTKPVSDKELVECLQMIN